MGAGPSKKAPDEEVRKGTTLLGFQEGGTSPRSSMEVPEDPVMLKLEQMMDLIDEEDEGPSGKFKQLLADVPVNAVRNFLNMDHITLTLQISRVVKWGFTLLQNAIHEARPGHTRLLLEHG